jgi:diguanylate cyclase (GGDEF)-like protein
MEGCLRNADLFGRYGGEEFLAVLPETDLAAALHLAERMRDALTGRLLPLPAGGTIGVTGSFGVAGREELDGEVTADRLVTLADERLYAAKAAGRDCVRP